MEEAGLWNRKERVPFGEILKSAITPRFFRVGRLRKLGKVGKNLRMGAGSVIHAMEVDIGDNVDIAPGVVIKCRKLKIGAGSSIGMMCYFDVPEITIGHHVKIREQVLVGGMTFPDSSIKIGNHVTIYQNAVLNPTKPITIGNGVGIGGSCYIFTHGSWQSVFKGYPAEFGPVVIEDGAWLPWQVFVMPNVRIGKGATIGARSLVTKDVPPYALAVGSPAKVVREKQDYLAKVEPERKLSLLKEIVSEFGKYCEFMGTPVEIKEIGGGWVRLCTTAAKPGRRGEQGGLLISLSLDPGKPALEKGKLENVVVVFVSSDFANTSPWSEGIPHIRPDAETKSGRMNPIAVEFIEFLERYGVRFMD